MVSARSCSGRSSWPGASARWNELPIDLVALAIDDAWRGDFAAAVSLIAECDAVCEATGAIRVALIAAMFLGALRGDEAEVTPLIEGTLTAAEGGEQGSAATGAHWAAAVLHNGLGRYAGALAAAEKATRDAQVFVSILVVPELRRGRRPHREHRRGGRRAPAA